MTSHGKIALTLFLFAAFATTVSANAASIDTFTLSGSGTTITFSLPGTMVCCSPGQVTSLFSGNGTISQFSGFEVNGVLITVNGGTPTLENIAFYTDGSGGTVANGGGLAIGALNGTPDLVNEMGAQLFSLQLSPFSATFLPGTYPLSVCTFAICGFTPGVNSDLSLTITSTAPPNIPEPSTLLLLGSGLIGAAGAVRRKLRV